MYITTCFKVKLIWSADCDRQEVIGWLNDCLIDWLQNVYLNGLSSDWLIRLILWLIKGKKKQNVLAIIALCACAVGPQWTGPRSCRCNCCHKTCCQSCRPCAATPGRWPFTSPTRTRMHWETCTNWWAPDLWVPSIQWCTHQYTQ